jgi:hypothetical protein
LPSRVRLKQSEILLSPSSVHERPFSTGKTRATDAGERRLPSSDAGIITATR